MSKRATTSNANESLSYMCHPSSLTTSLAHLLLLFFFVVPTSAQTASEYENVSSYIYHLSFFSLSFSILYDMFGGATPSLSTSVSLPSIEWMIVWVWPATAPYTMPHTNVHPLWARVPYEPPPDNPLTRCDWMIRSMTACSMGIGSRHRSAAAVHTCET